MFRRRASISHHISPLCTVRKYVCGVYCEWPLLEIRVVNPLSLSLVHGKGLRDPNPTPGTLNSWTQLSPLPPNSLPPLYNSKIVNFRIWRIFAHEREQEREWGKNVVAVFYVNCAFLELWTLTEIRSKMCGGAHFVLKVEFVYLIIKSVHSCHSLKDGKKDK